MSREHEFRRIRDAAQHINDAVLIAEKPNLVQAVADLAFLIQQMAEHTRLEGEELRAATERSQALTDPPDSET